MSELRRHIMMQQRGGLLPSEYQQVDRLNANINAYLSIDYYPTQNTRIHIGMSNNNINGNAPIFGVRNESYVGVWSFVRNFDFGGNGSYRYNFSSMQQGVIYDIEIGYKNGSPKLIVDGSELFQYPVREFSMTKPFLLWGGWNGASLINNNSATFTFCEIYESDVLQISLYPCYRKSDNVAGMYDIVNDIFYTSAGTGTFIVGADV